LDLKKKSTWQGMGVVWVGFLRNKKKPGKTQKVVEDYNNGNNVFLFVFYIDYLHKKDRKKPLGSLFPLRFSFCITQNNLLVFFCDR